MQETKCLQTRRMWRRLLGVFTLPIALLAVIPILAIGLVFWLVGSLTRLSIPLFKPTIVLWPELFEFDPVLGWKAKSSFSGYCLEERDDIFQVTTDSDGWPGTRTLSDSKVVVFGDSHAFGYGVDSNRGFFELARVPIKAIGAPGYSMVQEVLLMEQLTPSLKGKLVVWFVYYGNDLYDNLAPEMGGYRTPFVTQMPDRAWTIVTRHINPSKWIASFGRQGRQRHRIPQKLYRRSFLGDRAYSACEFLIRKGRDVCEDAGADLVVITIPTPAMLDASPLIHGDPVDATYPDRMIRQICEKLDVHVVCLKDHLTRCDYKAHDEHWSERGHRKVARVIEDIYQNKVGLKNERRFEPLSIGRDATA